MNYPNGVETTYTNDAASLLLGLVHRLGATTNSAFYGYNRVGNRTNLTSSGLSFLARCRTLPT
jgi:hypothetical protein